MGVYNKIQSRITQLTPGDTIPPLDHKVLRADSTPLSNTPYCNIQMLLNTLISRIRVIGAGIKQQLVLQEYQL